MVLRRSPCWKKTQVTYNDIFSMITYRSEYRFNTVLPDHLCHAHAKTHLENQKYPTAFVAVILCLAFIHSLTVLLMFIELTNGAPTLPCPMVSLTVAFSVSPTDVFTDILYSHLTCTTICKICYQLPCHSADLDSQLTIPIKEF